jgi:hypothetical protein
LGGKSCEATELSVNELLTLSAWRDRCMGNTIVESDADLAMELIFADLGKKTRSV